MRWPWKRTPPTGSLDARAAVEQAGRAMADTERLIEHVRDVTARAHEVADRSDQMRARNHLAEAVWLSMRRGRA